MGNTNSIKQQECINTLNENFGNILIAKYLNTFGEILQDYNIKGNITTESIIDFLTKRVSNTKLELSRNKDLNVITRVQEIDDYFLKNNIKDKLIQFLKKNKMIEQKVRNDSNIEELSTHMNIGGYNDNYYKQKYHKYKQKYLQNK